MLKSASFQAVIIGGGFFGLRTALYLYEDLGVRNILVIEKEQSLMSRASYVNQARVHNGYHYPRSILTGFRSASNFSGFVQEYSDAIVNDFDKYYAVARKLSKVNARQFEAFCGKIDVDLSDAPRTVQDEFTKHLIEKVFLVKEYAFNAHLLRDILVRRLSKYEDIYIHTGEESAKVESNEAQRLSVVTNKGIYTTDKVFNCTYSQINTLHRRSNIPLVGLKHEIAEMCLVELPKSLKNFSITVMDGPFFSIMPFPSRGLHTLSHVRYTPHTSWIDNEGTPLALHDTHAYLKNYKIDTAYKKMKADVIRYIPRLKDMKLVDTISEVKTVLEKSEDDVSRPILFKPDFGLKGYNCIMGGKLDNIYDILAELKILYEKN